MSFGGSSYGAQVFGESTATSSGDASASPSGVSATGTVGTATATGGASVSTSGVQAAGSIGTATAKGDGNAAPAGVSATGDVGTAVASGPVDGSTSPSGVQATGYVGTAIASGGGGQASGGYWSDYPVTPRRTAEDRRRQREELGILPKRVESAINAVVERQADKAEQQVTPTFDYEAARRQLQAEFDRRNIELKAIYTKALEDQLHAKLLQLALAAKQRQEDDDESAVHLLLM